MDTLNFSFWSEEPSARCKVEFKGKKYTGYFSLLAAMNKALEVCSPIDTGYRKFSEIKTTLGIWASIVILQNNKWEVWATLDLSSVAISQNM